MSAESFAKPTCVLCYGTNFQRKILQSRQELITQQTLSNCIKHIPSDILQPDNLVFYNDEVFCTECHTKIWDLSKLTMELEGIQKKIDELVNNITIYVTNQREEQNSGRISKYNNLESWGTNFQNSALVAAPNVTTNTTTEHLGLDTLVMGNNPATRYFGRDYDDEDVGNYPDGQVISRSEISTDNDVLSSTANSKESTNTKSNQPKLQGSKSGGECETCHKNFWRMDILQKHKCGDSTSECDVCGFSFFSSATLKLHTRSHTGEKPYKCETCGKSFSIKVNLRHHINIHTGKKPFECKICQKRFANSSNYIKHKVTHGDQVRLNCDVCPKSFTTRKALSIHLLTHSDATSYRCDLCSKVLSSPRALSRHKRSHFGEKRFKCNECEKEFASNHNLKGHTLMIHRGENKPFGCKDCERTFWKAYELKTHELRHKNIKFQCEGCGKSYLSSKNLQRHQKHQCNPKPDFWSICDLCGKSIVAHNLKKHIRRVHENYHPFKCDVCHCKYKEKTAFARHNTRYCHICHKMFTSQEGLLAHQTGKHTVNSNNLYSEESSDGESNTNTVRINKRTQKFKRKNQNSNEDSSSDESIDQIVSVKGFVSDSDTKQAASQDFEVKIEIKSENEFSEIEDW